MRRDAVSQSKYFQRAVSDRAVVKSSKTVLLRLGNFQDRGRSCPEY
jgi:hypothetical protein